MKKLIKIMSYEEILQNKKLEYRFCPDAETRIKFEIKYKHIPTMINALTKAWNERHENYAIGIENAP